MMKIFKLKLFTASCLWAALVIVGFGVLTGYENSWGRAAVAPSCWPRSELIRLSELRPTLLLFAHPSCPCTRATIEELNQLMCKRGNCLDAYVFLLSPNNKPANWNDSEMRANAARIKGVTVINDSEGAASRQFGSSTSGQLLLYGVDGRLLFSGGITASRGHVGDNSGLSRLIAALDQAPVQTSQAPVFGCQLHNSIR